MKGWFACITSPVWALYTDWEALLQWEMEYDISRRRACTLGKATVLETLRLHDYSWIDQRIKNRKIWKWGQPKECLLWEHGCLFFFNSLIRPSRISFPKCLDLHSFLSCFCALIPCNTGLQQNVSTSSSSCHCRPDHSQPQWHLLVSSAGFCAVHSSLALEQSIIAVCDSIQVLWAKSWTDCCFLLGVNRKTWVWLHAARSTSNTFIIQRCYLRIQISPWPFVITFKFYLREK